MFLFTVVPILKRSTACENSWCTKSAWRIVHHNYLLDLKASLNKTWYNSFNHFSTCNNTQNKQICWARKHTLINISLDLCNFFDGAPWHHHHASGSNQTWRHLFRFCFRPKKRSGINCCLSLCILWSKHCSNGGLTGNCNLEQFQDEKVYPRKKNKELF